MRKARATTAPAKAPHRPATHNVNSLLPAENASSRRPCRHREGAYRVPEMIRWPGKIKPCSVSNEIVQHHDWLPTFLAAAGDPDVVERLKVGMTIAGKDYRVHIDGFNLVPYLTGQTPDSQRDGSFYFSDDGDLVGLRFDNWKIAFAVQEAEGTFKVWQQEFSHPRVPYIFNLRTDPFERAQLTSNTYYDWLLDHAFVLVPAQTYVAQFLATFQEFPPSAASFTVGQALQTLKQPDGD
jgi:arylsulfatase A-like enzyme